MIIFMCMIYRWVAYGLEDFRGLSSTLRSRVRYRQWFLPDTHLHASGGKPWVTPQIRHSENQRFMLSFIILFI